VTGLAAPGPAGFASGAGARLSVLLGHLSIGFAAGVVQRASVRSLGR